MKRIERLFIDIWEGLEYAIKTVPVTVLFLAVWVVFLIWGGIKLVTIHETPTPPTKPQPVTLICIKCEEVWEHPHTCDVVSGETLVKVIRHEG